MDDDAMAQLDAVCDKYGYSRARLIETIYAKCAVVIDKNSLLYLMDELDKIQVPRKPRSMI